MTQPDLLFRWRMALLDSEASLSERMVGIVISLYMGSDGNGAWPSVRTIASKARLSRRSVHRALAALKERGWISVEQRPGRPSIYRASFPEEYEDATCDTDGIPTCDTSVTCDTGDTGGVTLVAHRCDTGGTQNSPINSSINSHLAPSLRDSAPTHPSENSQNPKKTQRGGPHAEIFSTLAELFREPSTRSARAFYAKIAKELHEAGATPEQVRARFEAARKRFGNWEFSPAALSKHWDSLAEEARSSEPKPPNYEERTKKVLKDLRSWRPPTEKEKRVVSELVASFHERARELAEAERSERESRMAELKKRLGIDGKLSGGAFAG